MSISLATRRAYLQERLAKVQRDRRAVLDRLRWLDVEEVKLRTIFGNAFPGEDFGPPQVPWEELSYNEQLTVHFIAHRGRVRQLGLVAQRYAMDTGDILTENAFTVRLSRLKDKGVLQRCVYGWSVAESYLEKALLAPTAPRDEELPPNLAALNRKLKKPMQLSLHSWRSLKGSGVGGGT